MTRMAAYNKRFHASGAVTPQTILYEIQRYYPTASVVKPPPRKAAGTLEASRKKRGKSERDGMKTEKVEKSHGAMQRF